jgi:cation transport regulator ChaC
MPGVWVFGYGSLVSPASFGRTLGRSLQMGVDVFPAELHGFGRRWNYGVLHVTAMTIGERPAERTIVALGVVESTEESVNGVVGWVDEHELIELDLRERHYDRVDVTDRIIVDESGGGRQPGAVMVYVPRPEAIAHYESARRRRVAAIERRYWDLVDTAFADLGSDHHTRFHATTPPPDVPIEVLVRS